MNTKCCICKKETDELITCICCWILLWMCDECQADFLVCKNCRIYSLSKY